MSVRVMSWVWSSSQAGGNDRLVLLAIADCASDDGGNAYPSMPELVRKTNTSRRTVQRSLAALVKLGELVVSPNAGPKGCNRYRVKMTPRQNDTPANLTPGQDDAPRQSDAGGASDCHPDGAKMTPGTVPEPSEEPSEGQPPSSSETSFETADTTDTDPGDEAQSTARAEVEVRPDVEKLCDHLVDRIVANGSKRPAITKTWRDEARRLLDIDERPLDKALALIDWCQDDPFWRSCVQSMPKFRKQYDQLRLKALAEWRRDRAGPGRGSGFDDDAAAAAYARAQAREAAAS